METPPGPDQHTHQQEVRFEHTSRMRADAANVHTTRPTGDTLRAARRPPPQHEGSRHAGANELVDRVEQYYRGGRGHEQSQAEPRPARYPLSMNTAGDERGHFKRNRSPRMYVAGPGKPDHGPEITITPARKRRAGRHYASSPKPATQGIDQNSNEMLDDYYDGFDDNELPHTTSIGLNHEFGEGYVPVPVYSGPPPPPPPSSRPPRPFWDPGSPPPDRIYGRPPHGPDYIMQAPYRTAIWDRAAVWNAKEEAYDVLLKLVLTRHGERYSGGNFAYRSGKWTDIVFARKLNQQYHNLKTAEVGIVQKLTAYKKISFVYFIQFHAFPDIRYPATGAWLRTDRRPITFKDNAMTRNSFMNQLRRMCKKKSILYSALTGKPREFDERPPIRWVTRLDELIEPGAVIDIDIKETFDSTKIYIGLLLAIAVSLGAALGYGFAMDNDFSTGFSIASWAITALGFFAAVIAAGEYLGLDGPKATLLDADGHDRPWR